jgi:hypothetical protein
MSAKLEAARYLHRCGSPAEGKPVRCIGDAGWMPSVAVIERVGARQRDEGGDLRPEGDHDPLKRGLQQEERVPSAMENRKYPRGVWGMHKQLIVCVAIITGICLFVAGLGREGLLALLCTMVLASMVAWLTQRREGAKNEKNTFRWEDVDP